jgi:hypothetical protein
MVQFVTYERDTDTITPRTEFMCYEQAKQLIGRDMTRYIFLTQRRRTRRLVLGVVYFVTLAAGGTVALMAYFEGQI